MTLSRSLFPALVLAALGVAMLSAQPAKSSAKQSIAHRGASAYRPEHTEAAYRLAIDQKVDFVEQDLGVTKDGQLICIHDDSLERTTNVAEVFPDRSTTIALGSRTPAQHWLVNDFTLAEVKRLDAGKWFKPEYAGARLLTFQEAIDLVRAHAGFGMYPELKSPQLYKSRGIDQVKLFVDAVKKNGLEKPDSLKTTPVIIQSFDEEAIRRVSVDLPAIPRVFLTSNDDDVSEARLRALARFSTGIAPEKFVIARHPDMVAARGGGFSARARAREVRQRAPPQKGAPRPCRRPDRHLLDVPQRRKNGVSGRRRRDGAFSLRSRHRRAVHEQPGSIPAALIRNRRRVLQHLAGPPERVQLGHHRAHRAHPAGLLAVRHPQRLGERGRARVDGVGVDEQRRSQLTRRTGA